MSSHEDVDVKTNNITTERDLFLSAVKVEGDDKPASPPVFTFVDVKLEPGDANEMSSLIDEILEEPDGVLQPMEHLIIDSLMLQADNDEETCKAAVADSHNIENGLHSRLTGEGNDSDKKVHRNRKRKKTNSVQHLKMHQQAYKAVPTRCITPPGFSSRNFNVYAGTVSKSSAATVATSTKPDGKTMTAPFAACNSSFRAVTPQATQPTCFNCCNTSLMFSRLVALLECQAIELKNLKASVDSLKCSVESRQGGVTDRPNNEPISGLPCSTIQELECLNEDLRDAAKMQKTVVILGLLGGRNIKSAVWSVLKKVMKKSVAERMNWTGINGKRSLKEFPQVLEVISLAVTQMFPKTQLATIYNIIKPWLRGARDREGCRMLRRKESRLRKAAAAQSQRKTIQRPANEQLIRSPESNRNINAPVQEITILSVSEGSDFDTEGSL